MTVDDILKPKSGLLRFVVICLVAAAAIYVLTNRGTEEATDELARLPPDERACMVETKAKFLRLTEAQIAAFPGSTKEAFTWEVMECVGRKRLVKQKLGQ